MEPLALTKPAAWFAASFKFSSCSDKYERTEKRMTRIVGDRVQKGDCDGLPIVLASASANLISTRSFLCSEMVRASCNAFI
jgi:hypothetical protein